jgi:hypothetical protein
MRALRVVGITEGGDVVLEDPGRRERFTVPADEQLRAAARGDLTRLGQIAIELESQLRPREIQARIRAGASVEQVAAAAGVPVQKIERFAYPVLLERSRTADVAQRAHPVRADGPDVRTLGDVVAHTFGLRGQEYAEAEWDSWKGEDGRWVVVLSWRAGRSDNRAHWTFQPGAHGGTVTALDEPASDLVEGLPLRPLRPVGPVIDIARPDEPAPVPHAPAELRAAASDTLRAPVRPVDRTGGERSAERAAADRATAERIIAERAAADRAEAERAAAEQAEAERAEAERAEAEQVEAERAEAERVAAERAEAERAEAERVEAERVAAERAEAERVEAERVEAERIAAERAAAERAAAERAEAERVEAERVAAERAAAERAEAERVEAERVAAERAAAEQSATPASPAEEPAAPADAPAPAAEAPARRTKKGKPVMPSWDEVLLGVRGQR